MPLLERPAAVFAALAYLAVILAIGIWSARRTHTAKDFFIAGQRIGLLVTGLATMSAAFSGFVFVGGPGLTYRLGLTALWIAVPVGVTAGMLCWVVAKRLRLLAEVREIYTVPDAVLCRYRSRVASGLAALAILLGTLGYLGVQFKALGVLLGSILGTRETFGDAGLAVAMAIGVAAVLAYAVVGGMVAGVYTDLFQGILMMAAAIMVFIYALRSGGGLTAMTQRIAGADAFGPSFLEPLGGAPLFTAVGFFFVFSVGTLGQPHMLHKFYMLDDPRKLKWMPAILGGSQALCLLIWFGIGLAVPALVAEGRLAPLAGPDDAAPAFLLGFTPGVLAGMVFAGILAAIMSTADSFLNIGSAALVRDLPRAFGKRVRNELVLGRVAVVGVAVGAALFAYLYDDLIALLGTFAFGIFGASLAPALAIGLNWRRVTSAAASASIATGLVVTLALEFLARQSFLPGLPRPPLAAGVLPAAAALAASLTVLFAVTLWTGRGGGEKLDSDVVAVMEA